MHHLEDNIAGAQGGSLPDTVVMAFDKAWEAAKAVCPPYFR